MLLLLLLIVVVVVVLVVVVVVAESERTLLRTTTTCACFQNNLIEYHCMVDFVRPNSLGTLHTFQRDFVQPILNGQCVDSTAADVRMMRHRSHVLHDLLKGCVDRADYKVGSCTRACWTVEMLDNQWWLRCYIVNGERVTNARWSMRRGVDMGHG